MITPNPEILLLNIPRDLPAAGRVGLCRFRSRTAPLGLYCLAAIAPERIQVVDAANSSQLFEALAAYNPEQIKALILQWQSSTDSTVLNAHVERLRQMFPGARIGGSHELSQPGLFFDFIINGTGKTSLLRILRGDRLNGVFHTIHEDLATPLQVPTEPLFDAGYELAGEKWLWGKTIEIFQPWLGLLDQHRDLFSYPGVEWFKGMVEWLQASGFSAFHFCPSGLRPEDLHELRSVMLNLRAPFAVSFSARDAENIRAIGKPLRQIWLYEPSSADALITFERMRQIKDAGCQACLQVNRQWLSIPEPARMIALADRLVISDMESWATLALKHIISKFWGYRRRFFNRLFSLKSASELIIFMKTSYMILEILFSSEKNGRC